MLLFILLLVTPSTKQLKLEDVTNEIGLNDLSGDLALGAIADLNSDRYNDLLLVNRSYSGDELMVFLWNIKKHRFQYSLKYQTNSSLVSTSAADFDGDGWVDILLVLSSIHNLYYTVSVVWNKGEHQLSSEPTLSILDSLEMLPLIFDFNGDHLPDILSVVDNQLMVWISENHTFVKMLFPDSDQLILSPAVRLTANYVDINSDCLSDIVITSYSSGGSPTFHIWLRDSASMNFSLSHSASLPIAISNLSVIYGLPSFVDMNADGVVDVILMSCDSVCAHPQVHLLFLKSVSDPLDCASNADNVLSWRLTWDGYSSVNISYPMDHSFVTERRPILGDINLDGYPDIILAPSSNHSNASYLLVMMNTHCKHCGAVNTTSERTLMVMNNELIESIQSVYSGIFIDLYEDGIFDIFLTTVVNGVYRFKAFRQSFIEDHLFLKATVLSGYCYQHCSNEVKPYGSSLPGGVVLYRTHDRNGRIVIGKGSTVLGSAVLHNPSLPYIILGLGETPNYIEKLVVGIPHDHHYNNWYRKWELLIPNSQVIVVPDPPSNPDKWLLLLYLTPSTLVYSVAGVLSGLCIGLLVAVVILHIRDKWLDRKERKTARQKFHFNVM